MGIGAAPVEHRLVLPFLGGHGLLRRRSSSGLGTDIRHAQDARIGTSARARELELLRDHARGVPLGPRLGDPGRRRVGDRAP
jgi:hypothetical protein